jgi:phosphatidylserine/phosphatidylglycerophosphate/cardiolipin synthase-like enzyme
VALVNSARDDVMIENPYVVLTEEMLQVLAAAARRGVRIWIGTNSPLSTDSTVTQAFFLDDWMYILARVPTARLFVATGRARLHAKVATIDDDITLVSTYNLDFLSGFVNGEVGAVVWSREMNRAAREAFGADRRDPTHGVREYRIQRGPDGAPLLMNGQPTRLFGPEDHLPAEICQQYRRRRRLWNLVRLLPRFAALRRPPLVSAT